MSELLLAAGDNPLNHVVQHTLPGWGINLDSQLWAFPLISNHILMQFLAAFLLLLFLPKAVRMFAGNDAIGKLVPRGFGNAIEMTCVALRDVVFRPNLGKHADAFTPFLWSLFFFLLACNLLGLIPLADWFFADVFHHQIGGTSTGNVWVTGALGAMVLVMIIFNGLRHNGFAYVRHFFMGPFPVNILIGVLEMAGLIFKSAALAIRLFANMLAGHVMLAVVLSFASQGFALGKAPGAAITVVVFISGVLLYFLELFVAFLHAFIFTMLTAVFIGQAINIHHDDDHGEEAAKTQHEAGP